MHKKFNTLLLQQEQDILILTLNRPQLYNAINHQMMLDLQNFWQGINKQTEKIRCIILTGSGDKSFCAGADLKERLNLDVATWQQQRQALEQAMLAMVACPIPVIAAVNGVAFGGGLELMLACDFAYAAKTATFAQSETKLGLIPGAMGTQNLPTACGIRRAKELCFTGVPFSAEQAYEWQIINKICPPQQLMAEVLATAKIISNNAPLAVQQAKSALNMSQQLGVQAGFAFEIAAYNKLLPTQDRSEGIRAFNEKRPPKFTGK